MNPVPKPERKRKVKKPKLPKVNKKKLNKECEELWKKEVKKSGICARCGKSKHGKALHAAHVYPKGLYRNHPIKWDIDNGIPLCAYDHLFWAHKHPIEFTDWFREKYPERAKYLFELSREIKTIDYEETLKTLKAL